MRRLNRCSLANTKTNQISIIAKFIIYCKKFVAKARAFLANSHHDDRLKQRKKIHFFALNGKRKIYFIIKFNDDFCSNLFVIDEPRLHLVFIRIY